MKASDEAKSAVDELDSDDTTIILDANTALNVFLFPPLFFFSALFYTDVMSTFAVLFSYFALLRKSSSRGNTYDIMNAIVIGVVALFFRQTNIFWVAVFPAGLSVVDALKVDSPSSKSSDTRTMGALLQRSWEEGLVQDCSMQDAYFQGKPTFCG
jgi:alpha-1,2-glucosyltransferase